MLLIKRTPVLVRALAACTISTLIAAPAQARVTRIVIDARVSPAPNPGDRARWPIRNICRASVRRARSRRSAQRDDYRHRLRCYEC